MLEGSRAFVFALLSAACLAAAPPCPAALAQPAPTASQPAALPPMEIVYGPPRCLGSGSVSINAVASLMRHFEKNPGSLEVMVTGFSGLTTEHHVLVPEEALADGVTMTRLVEGAFTIRGELLEKDVPVLVSPYEITFQLPYRKHFDFLRIIEEDAAPGGRFPDLVRRTADVWRYWSPDGKAVLGLSFDDEAEVPEDLLDWQRVFSALVRVKSPDDEVSVYSVGVEVGRGSRALVELAKLGAKAQGAGATAEQKEGPVVLMPGGVVMPGPWAAERDFCAERAASLRPAALVPREGELALGAEGLVAWASQHGLPYVAANLARRTPTGAEGDGYERPFPRFVVVRQRGLTLAVIGAVGRDQVERLPAAVRRDWKVEDVSIALSKATRDLKAQLGRRPDLTVALVSGEEGTALREAQRAGGVDVVVGSFDRYDLLPFSEEARVSDPSASRERTRKPRPMMLVRASPVSVGRLAAHFEVPGQAGAPPALRRVEHVNVPVLVPGPYDREAERAYRKIEESLVERASQVLLPDVAPMVKARPKLHPLVWGERVPQFGSYAEYEREYPARFTDALWMRFVTNLMRTELGADVALSRNLPRDFNTVGPITRHVLDHWLRGHDTAVLVGVRGRHLLGLSALLRRQARSGSVTVSELLFAAGLDADRGRIAGRPIEPEDLYTLATTDTVLALPAVAGELEGATGREERGLLRHLVFSVLERWASSGAEDAEERRAAEVEQLLLDHSGHRAPRWTLKVEEISAQGVQYRNTDNAGGFAASRETRVTTPDNLSIRGRAKVALEYDDPSVAWETRLDGTFDRIELDIEGQDIPANEPSDDLVLSTELRFNAIELDLGDEGYPMVPYLRLAWDTELTATPDYGGFAAGTPGGSVADGASGSGAVFPHQHLLRESVGQLLKLGRYVQEIRLGLVAQQDASEAPVRNDLGVELGLKLAVPIVGPLSFASDTHIRHLVRDDDDRDSDLGLVLRSVSKLLVSVGSGFAVFAFGDVYLVRGKLDSNDAVGGSTMIGLGLQYADSFRL